MPLALAPVLLALLPSLALELHTADDLLAGIAFGDEIVYLTGHDEADRTLHVEPIAGTWGSHCPACLLRQENRGARLERPASSATGVGRAAPRLLDPPRPLDAFLGNQAPRAPPAV